MRLSRGSGCAKWSGFDAEPITRRTPCANKAEAAADRQTRGQDGRQKTAIGNLTKTKAPACREVRRLSKSMPVAKTESQLRPRVKPSPRPKLCPAGATDLARPRPKSPPLRLQASPMPIVEYRVKLGHTSVSLPLRF